MNIESSKDILTSIFEMGGLGVFIYLLFRGLNEKIKGLSGTIEAQSKTLDVMERRIKETQSIGDLYKEFISEMPEDLRKYKEFIRESKDAMIQELQQAIEEKDISHKEEIEKNLLKIHEQEKAIASLMKARNTLITTNEAISSEMNSITKFYQDNNVVEKLSELNSINIYIQHKGELKIGAKNIENMGFIEHNDYKNNIEKVTNKAEEELPI